MIKTREHAASSNHVLGAECRIRWMMYPDAAQAIDPDRASLRRAGICSTGHRLSIYSET
jgi:hypothetical protein